MTPALEIAANQAVTLLGNDGIAESEAHDRVSSCVRAAVSVSQAHASQEELEGRIIDGRRATYPSYATGMCSAAAFAIAPFLPSITKFEFDSEAWLTRAANARGIRYDPARPALRWLELWHDQVRENTPARLIKEIVAANIPRTTKELAQYVGKLVDTFGDGSAELQETLDLIPGSDRLPFFSHLGRSNEYVRAQLDGPLGEGAIVAEGLIRTVRHVDRWAGDCTDMDVRHRGTLQSDGQWAGRSVLVYGQGQLLGSIKVEEPTDPNDHTNPSLLALVTVEDSGKVPLVRGGTYGLNSDVIDQAKEAYRTKARDERASITVDSLAVRPLRFIDYYAEGGIKKNKLTKFLPIIDAFRERVMQEAAA